MWKISLRKLGLAAALLAGSTALGATEAQATPCQEFTDAINWSKQSNAATTFPVEVYLTRHQGSGGTGVGGKSYSASDDAVVYAFGYLVSNGTLPILSGTLATTFANSDQGKMALKSGQTYYVEIAYQSGSGGQITYQQKFNGSPVGGAPATVVKATCVGDFLVTGANGNEVVTVGVSRQPSINVQPPK